MKDILLIQKNEESVKKFKDILVELKKEIDINIIATSDEIESLKLYERYQPAVVIIDAEMKVLNGFSLSAILRGMRGGEKCIIYMIVDDEKDYSKCDCENIDFFLKVGFNARFLKVQLKRFFKREEMYDEESDIQRAREQQEGLLPDKILDSNFEVNYLYSPFKDLSGDCLDYWCGEDKDGLYGFLFDVMGHDMCSFFQVSEVRAVFRYGFRFYQMWQKGFESLSAINENVNKEIFRLHNEDNISTIAAVVFYLDFKAQKLIYCSAGIPSFLLKKKNGYGYEEIKMKNYLIGYKEDAKYTEHEISLKDVDEIIFTSDGFSELLNKTEMKKAKHDDVSAIFIGLKRKENRKEVSRDDQNTA